VDGQPGAAVAFCLAPSLVLTSPPVHSGRKMTSIDDEVYQKFLVSPYQEQKDVWLYCYATDCENHRRLQALRRAEKVLSHCQFPDAVDIPAVVTVLSQTQSAFKELSLDCTEEEFVEAVFEATIQALQSSRLDYWLKFLGWELRQGANPSEAV